MAGTGAISLWNHYRELLWDGRRWVIAAVALFIGGTVSGYSAAISQPQMVIEAMTPLIQAVAQVGAQVVAASDPLTRTWVIFRMNAAAVTQFVALGVAGGLVPAINTFANGAMIGVVAAIGGNLAGGRVSPGVMVASIAPHAVFELPALWLASAWGMKLGVSWLLPGASGRPHARVAGDGVGSGVRTCPRGWAAGDRGGNRRKPHSRAGTVASRVTVYWWFSCQIKVRYAESQKDRSQALRTSGEATYSQSCCPFNREDLRHEGASVDCGRDPVAETAETVLHAVRQLDIAARKGVIHKNNAARRKSRLMRRLNALTPA